MSNVIKGDRVLYSKAPRVMQLPVDSKAAGPDAPAAAADSALRSAFAEADETRNRAKIEAHFAYQSAIREGMQCGHADGLEKGIADGEKRAAENIRAVAGQFAARMQALEDAYLAQLAVAREDCFAFAFGLAEEVLGGPVDRAGYAPLLEQFLSVSSSPATLEADGNLYPFKSCRGDILLQAAEELRDSAGMQGISLRAELPNPISVPDLLRGEPQAEPEVVDDAAQQQTMLLASAADGAEMESAPVFEEAADGLEETERAEAEAAASEPQTEPEIGAEADAFDVEDVELELAEAEAAPSEPQRDENAAAEDVQDGESLNDYPEAEQDYAEQSAELIDSEKFVFVRPARKAVSPPINADSSERQKFTLENLAALGAEHQKAVLRKAEVPDIAAALTGADETTRETLLNAIPRRAKQNVLDALHYLGPVSQADADAAKDRISAISQALLGERRGGEDDD